MRPPSGANINKIYRYIPKWLPLVLSGDAGTYEKSIDTNSPEREVWTHTKAMSRNRYVRIEATGAIETSTILTLIAFVASIQNNDGIIKVEESTVTLIINDVPEWMKKYLGHKNCKELGTDVQRLISYQIFWTLRNGDFTTHKYVYDGELKNNKLTVILKKSFVEQCVEKGLEIEFVHMQKKLRKKPVAKLLYLYLCSNSATLYNESTLIERTGLRNNIRSNRRTLKNAFKELKTATLIKGWVYNDISRQFSFTIPVEETAEVITVDENTHGKTVAKTSTPYMGKPSV
ncbi:MAG: hypothetical protein WCK54_20285 [Desulfuromonadales bacterium]